jgi:hypothetical protein
MKADNILTWFALNDMSFGMSLLNKEPEDQVREICEKYGFSFEDISSKGDDSEEYLLKKLNEIS